MGIRAFLEVERIIEEIGSNLNQKGGEQRAERDWPADEKAEIVYDRDADDNRDNRGRKSLRATSKEKILKEGEGTW